MRILYVCGDGIFSGLERITLQLVTAARSRGHEVLCLGSLWGSGEFTAKILEEQVPLERTWLGFISLTPRWQPLRMTFAQLRALPAVRRDFRRIVCEWRPDIIHFSNFHHVFLLACMPRVGDVPWVFHVHNAIEPSRTARVALRVVGRRVERFVAVGHFVGQRLIALGVPESKVSVVINGVPPPSPATDPGDWRSRSHWGAHDVLVGIVGQVGPWKGHENFIRAIAFAQQAVRTIKAVVIGTGSPEYERQTRALADRLCIPGSVAFTGFCHDMSRVYSQLDLVVVPSAFDDPFPLVPAEAMSYGRAVVATARGGLPEILGEELREWLVPDGDIEALAAAIAALARDPELRRRVGERGRERAAQQLSLDACVDGMLNVYVAVAGSGPSGRAEG